MGEGPDVCLLSERVDGKKHSWKFDGDDPYVICHYCGEIRDALTGRVMTPGRQPVARKEEPADTAVEGGEGG